MKKGIQGLGDMVKGNCTHYWIIDSDNVGYCKYCPAVKDYGELLRQEGVFVVAGRRGTKASKGVARRPYRSRGMKKEKLKGELL